MKKTIMIMSALGLTAAFEANMDYCNVYQQRDITIFGHKENSSSYCCKNCCFISITSAKKCTKNFCESTCPADSFDKQECLIAQNGDSFGCDKETEYCMLTDDPEPQSLNSEHYNKFICAKKKEANEYCDKSEQCASGMCSTYPHRPNFCYGCIGERKHNETKDNYGQELTHDHCNVTTQFCALDNSLSENTNNTCQSRQGAGAKCYKNNYMCTSNNCDDELDTCDGCEKDSDCPSDTQQCVTPGTNGVCKQKLAVMGADCSADSDCVSGLTCSGSICKGMLATNDECYHDLMCLSGVCNMNSQCGPIDGKMVDPNEAKSSHVVIIVLLCVVIALGAVVIIVQKRKHKKNVEDLGRNFGIQNGSANSNSLKFDEQDDSAKQNLVDDTPN